MSSKIYLLLLCAAFAAVANAQTRRSAMPGPDTIVVYDTIVRTVTVRIYRPPVRPRAWAAVPPLPVVSGRPVASRMELLQDRSVFLSIPAATIRPGSIIVSNKTTHVHKIETMKKHNFLSLAFLALTATSSLHGQRFILNAGVGYAQTADARLPIRHFPFLRLGWAGPRSELTAGLQIVHRGATLPMTPEIKLTDYQQYYGIGSFQADVSWLRVLETFGRVRLSGGGGVVWSHSYVNTLSEYTLKPSTEIVKSAQFESKVYQQIGGTLKAAIDFRLTKWLHLTATGGYVWLPGTPSAPADRHLEDLVFVQTGVKLALGRK